MVFKVPSSPYHPKTKHNVTFHLCLPWRIAPPDQYPDHILLFQSSVIDKESKQKIIVEVERQRLQNKNDAHPKAWPKSSWKRWRNLKTTSICASILARQEVRTSDMWKRPLPSNFLHQIPATHLPPALLSHSPHTEQLRLLFLYITTE